MGIGEGFGQIPRATGNIKHIICRFHPAKTYCLSAPSLVESEGMDPVIEVITVGNGCKHSPHALRLVPDRMRIIYQVVCGPDDFIRRYG